MQDTILSKLEASRKELLDLGLRNPLINYRLSKSRGLSVVREKSVHVYDLLVQQGKALSFTAVPEKGTGATSAQNPGWDESNLPQLYTDTKLQTNETETALQHKLLNTFYAARTNIEEQGVNILYLALGMLQWYEAGAGGEKRLAPLVLVPVKLERSSARERFRVRYSEEEVGHNLSLQAKLKTEFGIQLPAIAEPDEFSIGQYFEAVSQAVQPQQSWQVLADQIELGFFSFGKFMLFHDLDNDEWPDEKRPVDHPLLQSLFHHGFHDAQPSAGEDSMIDTETNAHELFQVVDADSSQILSLLAVHEGRNMVIQGPPGTGKSQTITNIIANAVGQGKKVLFVAEKMAALEVVKRRMENIGLGEPCLELHSHKASKKELHAELKRVLELGKPSIERLQEEVALLSRLKEEINGYCSAVNTMVGRSSLTVHQLYGRLLKISEEAGDVTLHKIYLPEIEQWTAERQQEAEAMAARIQARLHDIGVPSRLRFWGAGLRVLLPGDNDALKENLQAAQSAVEKLEKAGADIAISTGLAAPAKREEALLLAALLQMAAAKPDLEELAILDKAWLLQKDDINELLDIGERLAALKESYSAIFLPEAWEQSMLDVRQSLKEHGAKWYRFLIGDYNKAVKKLKAVCQGALPADVETRIQYAEDILVAQRLERLLQEQDDLARTLFGARWQRHKSGWSALKAAALFLQGIHRQVAEGRCPKELLAYLARHENPAVAEQYHARLATLLNSQGKSLHGLVEKLKLDEGLHFRGCTFQSRLFGEQLATISVWLETLPELQMAVAWNNLFDLAKEQNLECLTNAAIDWEDAEHWLAAALQKTWYEYLLEKAVTAFPALRKFERNTHEEVIRQFRKLDVLNLRYNRALAALRHWEAMPNIEADGQVRVLKGEFNKKARHLPVRKLMQEAGHAIQAIKPVFMMSPLSIANFLPPGAIEFDLVIFDEASQVRPVDALGALLRGKQLVVVGDTKQLPPTSFFDTLNDQSIEAEESPTADMPSILGMCDAQGAPQTMLRWHYRSRHESLIAVSNYEFYENKLVIFPSPGSRSSTGLLFHHLPQAFYDRGHTKTNPVEAEIVAQAVMDHAAKHPKLTLGVVAFSSAQREAIQDALEEKRRANPDLEPFFKTHAEEPFFIKNLENVQGDERDVIFISIGYGRTKEGYLSMLFGPLSNEGGERRLNVLITRAKLRCEVFSNITAADIDVSRTSRRGVPALKHFLHFAQHGKLDVPVETGRPFESTFEELVAGQLVRAGYTIRQQVGSQGFYLDLAVVDPEHPGRFLLGIECDGAAYHSARSARDRDRLRQQVLEGIGWRIHRIWSTDWFRHPERELKKTVEAIEKARQAVYLDGEPDGDTVVEQGFRREHVAEEAEALPVYETAVLPTEVAARELHLHTVGKLAGWISQIVQVESPVHFEEVARRMVEAAGLTRLGSRIRNQLELAAKFAEGGGRIKRKGDFLWTADMQAPVLRDRGQFPPASRRIRLIAPEELRLAIEKVVGDAIAIQPEAAVTAVARLLGFGRVTEEVRDELFAVLHQMMEEKIIRKEGELLKLEAAV